MEFFFIWIVCAFLSAFVASSKGRSAGNWFVLGFLFGPLGLLAVGLSGAIKKEAVETGPLVYDKETGTMKVAPTTKKCPYCAEVIQAEAIKCKHCHSDLSAT